MNNTLAKNITFKDILIKNKQTGYFFIKVIIAAGLLLFIINKINPKEILSAVLSADYYLIVLSFILSFFNIYLQFKKWETVCTDYLDIKNKKKVFLSLFHGFAGGIFTPARVGEYFSRGLALREKSLFQIAAATFIDKFFPLLIVAFFGGISFIFYLNVSYGYPLYLLSLIFLFAVVITLYLLRKAFQGRIFNYIPDRIKQNKKVVKILLNLEQLKRFNPKFILKITFISVFFYFCYLIQFVVLISAFSHKFNFIKYLWDGSLIMFTKSIIPQISLGELGIREGVSVYFLTRSGEIASVAFNASIMLFLINLVFPSLIGLLLLYKKGND